LLKAAQLIDASWPAGTIVFIDILPTRFLYSRLPEAEGGNYEDQFRRSGVSGTMRDDPVKCVNASAEYYLSRCSFFLSPGNPVKALVDGIYRPPIYYRQNEYR
jgi:hypothetical protein